MTQPDEQARITVMLVDDHQVVRAGLRSLLSHVAAIEIVGEAGTVVEAVEQALLLRPRVVLMDLRLPDGSGIDACREIRSALPSTRVLFLTSYSDEEAVNSSILGGASGYLLKDISHESLIQAIGDAAAGRPVLHANVTQPALARMQSLVTREQAAQGAALSPQECRVLALVVEGRTNKEIAAALGLSDKTVKNYLSNAFQKLRITRRAQAAALIAAQRGRPTSE